MGWSISCCSDRSAPLSWCTGGGLSEGDQVGVGLLWGEQGGMGVQGLTRIFMVYLLPSCPPLIRLHSSLVMVCELPPFCAKFS